MPSVDELMARSAELLNGRRGQCLIFLVFLDPERNTDWVLMNSDDTRGELEECLALGEHPVAFQIWPFYTAECVPVSADGFSIDDQAVINGLYDTEKEGPGYSLPMRIDQPGRPRPKKQADPKAE